jgi:aspartate carbamoyltransferase
MDFRNRDIITMADFTKEEIEQIMSVTKEMEKTVQEKHVTDLLSDKLVAVVFLEPSTRTRLSFVSAVHRLRARPVVVADAKSSSAAKGESLADTARTIDGYVDVIVIRQPLKGGAQIVADAAEAPVINGGDGAGQHPTQALLDLYTIQKEKGTLDGLSVAMVGDLRYGRTVHSLSYALSPFKPKEYIYCAPDELQMPEEIIDDMKKKSISCTRTDDIGAALNADVLYMTRIQKERFEDPSEYEKLKGSFILDKKLAESGNKEKDA